MKSILEVIVRTTWYYLGHFCPLGANGGVQSPDGRILEGGEVSMLQTRVEMVDVLHIFMERHDKRQVFR